MKKNKIISLVFLLVIGCFCSLLAQTDELMDRATKEYLRGDYMGAIEDFKRVLEMEENEKAEKLYYKSLVEEGKRRFNNGEMEKAKQYLQQAWKIKPGSSEVKDILRDVNEKLGLVSQEIEPEKEIEKLKQQLSRERSAKSSYRGRLNRLSAENRNLEKEIEQSKKQLEEAGKKIESLGREGKQRNKLLLIFGIIGGVLFLGLGGIIIIFLRRVYFSSDESRYQIEELEEKISEKLKTAEEESDKLEEKVARSINKMIDGQKEVVKRMSLSAAGKTQNDIEDMKEKMEKHFEQQQNRLIELLNQQARALSSEKTEKIEVKDEKGQSRVITDINPHVRARADGVEMIPKTVSDPNVAEKMLKPYLSDPNNRVRANACVAINQYNPELSMKTLKEMAESPDKWMRLSAAWAVGEIASPDVVEILRKLLDDIDEKVRERAINSFENLAEVKEDIGEEIRKMIENQKKKSEE
ncbi:MAG: HEAT repeat domain-containing protein [Elusimicrobiota bacterium]